MTDKPAPHRRKRESDELRAQLAEALKAKAKAEAQLQVCRQELVQTVETLSAERDKRRVAEEAWRQSEDYDRWVFEASLDASLLTTPDGGILTANPAACRMFGYTEAELQRLGRASVVDATDPRLPVALEERARTGQFSGELTLVRKDGTRFPAEISSAVFRARDGGAQTCMIIRDNTPIRRTEEALRHSQFVLNESQRIAGVGSWERDLTAERITWSDETYRLFGVQPDEFVVTYEAFLECVHPDDRAAVEAAYSRSLCDAKATYEKEYRLVKKDSGQVRTVLERHIHLRDVAGKIVGSIGIVHDITERQQAEEALRRSEARYHALFSEMMTGCALHEIVLDSAGQAVDYVTLEVNRAFESILETRREAVVGKRASEFLPPEELRKWLAIFGPVALETRSTAYEMYSPLNLKHFEGVAYCPERGRFAVTFADVTERWKTQAALQASERRLRATIDRTGAGYFRIGLDGRFQEVNAAWLRMHGYAVSDSVVGQPYAMTQVEAALPEADGIVRTLLDGKPVQTGEFSRRGKDGSIGYHTFSAAPVIESGRIVGLDGFLIDITDHKRTEEALREAELRYREVFVNSSECIFLLDVTEAGRFKFAGFNPAEEKATGFSSATVAGKFVEEAVPHDLAEQVIANYRRCVSEGTTIAYDEALDLPIGKRHFHTALIPVRNGRGAIYRIIGVARDITESKQAEEALRQEKSLAQTYLELAPSIIVALDADGCITLLNLHGARILECAPGQAIGKNWFDTFLPERVKEQVKEIFMRLLRGEDEALEYVESFVVTGKGNERNILWHNTLIQNATGDIIGTLSSGEDITERKQAEEALRDSEREYRQLVDTLMEGIWRIDENALTTYVNPRLAGMFGYAPEEMLGRPLFEFMDEQGRELATRLLERRRQGIQEQHDFEFRRKDGSRLYALLETSPILDDAGRYRGGIAGVADVTERRRAEEALERRNQELEFVVQLSSRLRTAATWLEMLNILFEHICSLLQADQSLFLRLTWDTLVVELEHCETDSAPGSIFVKGQTLPRASLYDESLHSRAPLYSPDLRELDGQGTQTWPEWLRCTADFVIVPIRTTATDIGLFIYSYAAPHAFTDAERRLVTAATEIAGNALSRAELMETLESRVETRTRELNVMYQLTSLASRAEDTQAMLREVLRQILENIQGLAGSIEIGAEGYGDAIAAATICLGGETIAADLELIRRQVTPAVIASGSPLIVSSSSGDGTALQGLSQRYNLAGFPIAIQRRSAGVLYLARQFDAPFNTNEISLLSAIAEALGVIAENMLLRRHAEEAAVGRERERLARELHDSVTQSLYGLTLFAKMGSDLIAARQYKEARLRLNRIGETAQQALKEMRLMIYQLRPLALEQDGLVGALQKRLDTVEKRAGMEATLEASGDLPLPPALEEGLYHIALEALNNTLKHSRANRVAVSVRCDEAGLRLSVADDGAGFDLRQAGQPGGLGLPNMRERARKMGCTLDIVAAPGEGTRVTVARPGH